MRKYKYYRVMYIIKSKVFFEYLTFLEYVDFVNDIIINNDVDYLEIKEITLKEYINNFGNIKLF